MRGEEWSEREGRKEEERREGRGEKKVRGREKSNSKDRGG